MTSLLQALYRASMGCLCSRESVTIEDKSYRVKEFLTEGGFSTIELVEDPNTGRQLVLKRILCHSTEDEIAARREVEFHRHLKGHAAVIRCVGSAVIGSADIVHGKTSEVLILLPYYERGSLHDELVRRSTKSDHFAEKFILVFFRQICQGVLHMHKAEPNPLAHRDLKPHNILLTNDMKPVIMDLGSMALARVSIKSHSQAQALQDLAAERCSMSYRPPELFQVNSKCDIDERSDVWSLGCLLYALCFFKSPYDEVFERGDSIALAVQSNSLRFPPDSPFSTDLHNLITWMLTPEMVVRPHLQQIMDRLDDMTAAGDKLVEGTM